MTVTEFGELLIPVLRQVSGRALDPRLERDLNESFPAGSELFEGVFAACQDAIAAGWMCAREAGGVKFGRVIKPGPDTAGFSVDVVEMTDIAGPHHRHPQGEIDMVMPLTPTGKFDGRGAGWLVYGPDSAHSPTVTGGKALVLYLLPAGAIEFSRSNP
jgi:hypothetical protein